MKAVLVIDKPENCYSCPLNHDGWCDITLVHCIDDGKIDHTCPLRPMPQKKELKGGWYHPADVWIEGANFGWNACLDALGETE